MWMEKSKPTAFASDVARRKPHLIFNQKTQRNKTKLDILLFYWNLIALFYQKYIQVDINSHKVGPSVLKATGNVTGSVEGLSSRWAQYLIKQQNKSVH